MTDHFAALDQPRRPWLDTEALKECFHRASATWHPDVPGSGDAARFAGANAAYSVLRDPAWRLRHLLELEAPEMLSGASEIPPEFAELFMRLAELRQALNTFQKKESAATQGLARALLIEERQSMLKRVMTLKTDLDSSYEGSLAALQALDAEWEPRAAACIERLAALQQRLAYLSKWRVQLSEALFKLQ